MKLFLPLLVLFSLSTSAQVLEKDSLALVDLYTALKGDQWTIRTAWLADPVDQWFGIETENGRVTEIDLYNNNLAGSIPTSIGNLDSLQRIQIGESDIQGGLPATLSQCTVLETISCANCGLQGCFPPEWASLKKLRTVSLQGNLLSGGFPEVFFQWPEIRRIEIGRNEFSGSLPQNLGDLSSLNVLGIADCGFEGQIPQSIRNLENIGALYFTDNNFTGDIGDFMTFFPNLFYLRLSGNPLHGTLASDYFDSTTMRWLDVDRSNIEALGDFSSFTSLNRLNVSGTKINISDLVKNLDILPVIQFSNLQDRLNEDTLIIQEGEDILLPSDIDGERTQYIWTRNGLDNPGWDSDSLLISSFSEDDEGTYQCIGTHPDFNVEIRSAPIYLKLDPMTSSNQESTIEDRLQISPNPAKNRMKIHLNTSAIAQLHIYDINGKLYKAQKFATDEWIDISDLITGTYFVIIDQSEVVKLVKN